MGFEQKGFIAFLIVICYFTLTMLETDRTIDPPQIAFARAKDLFGFLNFEKYPCEGISSMVRRKEFLDFDVECELSGEIGETMEIRVITKRKPDPILTFSLKPLRGATKLEVNYPMAIDVDEFSFPIQIPPVEIDEETGKQLAGVLVDWLERTFRSEEIDYSYSGTPTISVENPTT
jgi:hypothetical protein